MAGPLPLSRAALLGTRNTVWSRRRDTGTRIERETLGDDKTSHARAWPALRRDEQPAPSAAKKNVVSRITVPQDPVICASCLPFPRVPLSRSAPRHCPCLGERSPALGAGHPWVFRSDVIERPTARAGGGSRARPPREAARRRALESRLGDLPSPGRPATRAAVSTTSGGEPVSPPRRHAAIRSETSERLPHRSWRGRRMPLIRLRSVRSVARRAAHERGLEAFRDVIVDVLDELLHAGRDSRAQRRRATREGTPAGRHRAPARRGPRRDRGARTRNPLPRRTVARAEDRCVPRPAREPAPRRRAALADAHSTASATMARSRCTRAARRLGDRTRRIGRGPAARRRERARNGITNIALVEADTFDYLRDRSAGARTSTRSCSIRPLSRRPAPRSRPRSAATRTSTFERCACSPRGGLLFTASCSFHLTKPLFLDMLQAPPPTQAGASPCERSPASRSTIRKS